MRVLLFVCVSQALLFAVVFGHNEKQEEHHDDNVDDHTEETSSLQKIVPGNIKFAYALYTHLANKYPNNNLFFSPMSISLLFSMLSAGAKGQTQTQIYERLGFNMSACSEEDINKGFQQLLHFVNQPNTDLELNSANALFLEQHSEVIEKFTEDLKKFYESEVIHLDFQKGDDAKNQINSYVEKKTNGKIKNLLESVSPATLLVLINTIYFKGTFSVRKNPGGGKMKALLFLCVSAALVHVAVLYDGYLKLKVNKHYPPLNPQDYIYMIVAFKTEALDGLFEALENPDSSVRPTEDITIFIDKNWHPQNPNLQTVSKDFSFPDVAMSSVNAFVKEKTSGKIVNLVANLDEYTVTAIVNTNNALKVPSAGGSGWTKQLDGTYKMVENKAQGVTVIEIPYSPYLSILLAIPFPGKEEEVDKSLTSPTIEALRKSMTLQQVRMEVPRATIYAASFMAVDIVPLDDEELIKTRYGYKVAAQFP